MRNRFVVALLAACAPFVAPLAEASFITPPNVGGHTSQLAGNTVARPEDGSSILLDNAAGVVGQRGTRVNYSLLLAFQNSRYQNPDTGYDAKSGETPFVPLLWLSTDRWDPWFVGGGIYGSVGASFNFPGNPSAGFPNRFFSELTLLQLGLVVGREIAPGLRLAVQAAPTYGRIRSHAPSQAGPVSFDVRGLGISGVVGLIYDLAPGTDVGVAWRAPGIVWMDGDGDVADVDDDVSAHLHTPMNVTFGIAHQLTERLVVMAQGRWSDYSNFEKSYVEFDDLPVRVPIIAASRDTFRYGIGAEFAATEVLKLRAGMSREPWMIEGSAVSPLLADYTDWIYCVGAGFALGNWTIDATLGFGHYEDRVVTSGENPTFPGRYELESTIAGFSVTYLM